MPGAKWGWIAFIGAISVLFAASQQDPSASIKVTQLLRQELKSTLAERDHLQEILSQSQEEVTYLTEWTQQQELQLSFHQRDLKHSQEEINQLKKEVSRLNQEKNQLHQSLAAMQLERSQTRRNLEQLKQGLHQLLQQTEGVAASLAGPAPGHAQIHFEEEQPAAFSQPPSPARLLQIWQQYADEPLNDKQ
jgi:DNA repair exonuclease SbcCD ATPase subunit